MCRRATRRVGFRYFTNYLMFHFNDTPESLYRRMRSTRVSAEFGVAITGFPCVHSHR